MGVHEIVTCVLGLFTVLVGMFAGVLAWLGKGAYEDVRELRTKVTRLEAAAETHHEHGARLGTLENKLTELGTNLSYVVEWVKKQEDRRAS